MVPHANWHHPTSEHTKYSTCQQQCNGSKCSLWGMKMTTQPKLAEFSFYSLYCLLVSLNAEVFVVVVEVGCVQGSWSQVITFSCYSHCLPLTQNASKGYDTIFKNLYYNTDLVCFAKTVSPAPVFVRIPGSHHPGTRLRFVPGFRDPGSILILGQVTQYGNPYLICIILSLDHNLSTHSSEDKFLLDCHLSVVGGLLLFSTFGNEATREWCPHLVNLIIMHDHWVTTAIISVSNDPKDNRRPPHNIHQICFCKWLSLAHAQFKTFHEWLLSLYYLSPLKVVMNVKHKDIQHLM